jgi:L-iditol 2-dehydrogenase
MYMLAARLHGPADLRLEQIAEPGVPGPGQVLLRVKATGICGSDLHSYQDARIGDTKITSPLILGHEFAGVIEAVGPNCIDGHFHPIKAGTRVAVDPAQPCEKCEFCEQGHPNLCPNVRFCGVYPIDGSLCEKMLMPSRCCFPVPDTMSDGEAVLLEPLGVALHTMRYTDIRMGDSVAILGAGPIGLLILRLAKMAGAGPVYISDKFPWRLKLAEQWGGIPVSSDEIAKRIERDTHKRGVDIAIEAAWGAESIGQAAEIVRIGGRVVLVGIPSEDRLEMKHSTARRKGITIVMIRRSKLTYPRAIDMVQRGAIDLKPLISHRFPLSRAAEGFQLNTAYKDGVLKVIIECE